MTSILTISDTLSTNIYKRKGKIDKQISEFLRVSEQVIINYMNSIKIGQTVFIKPIGNKARRDAEIKECVVSKVGNKYFEVKELYRERFYKDSLISDGGQYISDYQAYLSKQEILDETEFNSLVKNIRETFSVFGTPKLTLDQLRQIVNIIK